MPTPDDVDPFDGVWAGLSHCPECNALHRGIVCHLCGHVLVPMSRVGAMDGHAEPMYLSAGAIPYSVFLLIDLMRFEWERPAAPVQENRSRPRAERPVIVILHWTLFETLMERFYASAFADLPGELGNELMRRFPSIAGRLDRLYRLRWDTTFWADLEAAGYKDAANHLAAVHVARNAFVHGDAQAIDDNLVNGTVAKLRDMQLGWIEVFNRRCTGRTNKVPLYAKDLSAT